MSTATVVAVLSTVLATIIFLAVIWVLYRLFRRGVAWLLKGVDLQVPPIALLVSFALAATIFTTGANNLWGLVYGLVRVLFVDFPRAVVEMSYASYTCGEAMSGRDFSPGSDCFFKVGGTIANGVQRLFANSLSYLTRVISLVQFFAAWAVLAWCIGDLVSRSESTGTSKGLRRLVADMSAPARLRLGLGSVIVVAAYLCFCAIVAVSLFKPVEKPQVLDHKALETSLNLAKLTNTGEQKPFSLRFPEELSGLPKDPGNEKIAAAYGELTDLWKRRREQVAAEQERLVQRATAGYMIENLNRVGSREQANHFLALNRWFQSSMTKLFTDLDRCREAILRVRWLAQTTSPGRPGAVGPDVTSMIRQESPPARRAGSTDPSPGGIGGAPIIQPTPWLDSSDAATRALDMCQSRSADIDEPPDRSDFGYTLGVVGDLSIWLLRTESMPLALITGLIGFGLFGALVSTFVRAPAGQSPLLDIFGVVCRGVSAAIVVFLAAYSGIAIVSQTSGDPNPYVVFVTCLVGAVFGEDVWLWAKNKFLPKGNGGSGGAPGGGTTPTSGAGAPPGGGTAPVGSGDARPADSGSGAP